MNVSNGTEYHSWPINTTYSQTNLCPVNVHWHLGAEHYSKGEYDEEGSASHPNHPNYTMVEDAYSRRSDRRAGVRTGFMCHHYDNTSEASTTEYEWKHCKDMHVGETYEIHWPRSAAGACGTPHQYQSPFYDGVFCRLTGQIIHTQTHWFSRQPMNRLEYRLRCSASSTMSHTITQT